MSAIALEADYLIIGAGAMGLAFADELIHRDPCAELILVDRRAHAGGHWNDAYGFVSLHQPAAYYGVNSLPLGRGGAALASGHEVLAYFGEVMRRLVASGRVLHLSMCEYEGREQGVARVRSLVAPERSYAIRVRRKLVDATYMNVEVPATTPPKYAVEAGLSLVPVNGLAEVREPNSGYVIIGAGKTGIDAVLFLLAQGVAPEAITWIVSNDAWLLRRERIQPGMMAAGIVEQVQLFARCSTLDELLLELESAGHLTRIDPGAMPVKYRCATVDDAELQQLRSVRNVVRMGRVQRIEAESIVLERGRHASDAGKLYVDCTADGLAKRPAVPVFAGDTITLQSVLVCQQVFSAALIAYVEVRHAGEAEQNALCEVVPHPEWAHDFAATQLTSLLNVQRWVKQLRPWLTQSRLSFTHHETQLDILIAGLRITALTPRVARRLRKVLAHAKGERSEPAASARVVLEHGPLRASAHAAGFEQAEDRPLVVCLHGFPDDASSFRHQLPVLAANGYRVLAPTMRGYEPSSQPANNDYTLDALAGDVIAWLDQLGEAQVHLVGHDWGAAVTYVAAQLAPERFRSLTAVAVPHAAHFVPAIRAVPTQARNSWYMLFFQLPGVAELALERDDWALVRRLWSDWSPGYTLSDDDWAQLRETFEAPGVKQAMLAYYRQNLAPQALQRAMARDTRVDVATLAVTGADDGCIDTRLFDHALPEQDFPRGLRIERIEGTGHFAHLERPELFNRLLLEWLGRH